MATIDGASATVSSPVMPLREVTRSIATSTQCMLWGRAAGRCEFAGCNRPLWKSSVTQEEVNVAQKAHIYAFSATGPRGHAAIPAGAINSITNLMLVCHECHQKIDRRAEETRYDASLLRAMKANHERRVEIATGIAPEKRSHILLYGANVGDHRSPLTYGEAAPALFPGRYPADDIPIELSMVNSSFTERDDDFWAVEAKNLRRNFDARVRERFSTEGGVHLSVFAFAPQPLLVLLGTLLGDIVPSDVYQRHREPPSWAWPISLPEQAFELHRPASTTGVPALVLAVSATVTRDRITAVLGPDASVWTITVPTPHNDVIQTRDQLSQFRSLIRRVLDEIKARHGQTATLHVFPAAPVAVGVELGRIRMPKADMPWHVYDQVNGRGGFVFALPIPYGG